MANKEGQLLSRVGDYQIRKYLGIPDAAINFLEEIAWGSEGAVYVNNKTNQHIREVYNPVLMTVQQGEKILSTAVFCNVPVGLGSKTFNCFYVKYFASSKEIRGKGITKTMAQKVMEAIREGNTEKTIYYASVESKNRGSYKAVQSAGYSEIGTIKTIGFSRFFPQIDSRVSRVTTEQDKREVLKLLREQYSGHGLVQFQAIFKNENYFVIRDKTQIVAGCQYHRGDWEILKMKGLMGKLILKVLPHMPILKKIFNPKRFQFLSFEGIYFKPGYEKLLPVLFESLLTHEKLNSAMFWLCDKCPTKAAIERTGKLGLVNNFVKDSDVKILAGFQGLSNDEIAQLREKPLYVSAFDYV
jgi:L-amino acid N-acyltransferase YncA